MKQIKPGEYKKTLCSWCALPAAWRSSGIGVAGRYSCNTHRCNLTEHERPRQDTGYMTEADYQTWGRL